MDLLAVKKADHCIGHIEQPGAEIGEILEGAVGRAVDQGKIAQQCKTLAFVGRSEWSGLHSNVSVRCSSRLLLRA